MKFHHLGGLLFLMMSLSDPAHAATFTKVGAGALACADRITFTIRLIDQYTVEGEDAIALKKIINRYMEQEWWVMDEEMKEAALPGETLSLYHMQGETPILILRIPVNDSNFKANMEYKDFIQELRTLVETRKLSKSPISPNPNDHTHVEKMKLPDAGKSGATK